MQIGSPETARGNIVFSCRMIERSRSPPGITGLLRAVKIARRSSVLLRYCTATVMIDEARTCAELPRKRHLSSILGLVRRLRITRQTRERDWPRDKRSALGPSRSNCHDEWGEWGKDASPVKRTRNDALLDDATYFSLYPDVFPRLGKIDGRPRRSLSLSLSFSLSW